MPMIPSAPNNSRGAEKPRITREYMPYGSVLIVDDAESNLYVVKALLTPYGLHIDTAGSGIEAIEKIKSGNEYSIVFMDHMMPVMNGIEAVKVLREIKYSGFIVALTADSQSGQSEMFLANGFDGYISKPINTLELDALLNKMIRDEQPSEVLEVVHSKVKPQVNDPLAQKPAIDAELKKFFLKEAENAAVALDGLLKNQDFADNEKIQLYITTLHAITSSLANIGESELSATALKLELAGRERDLPVIQSKTPGFTAALRALLTKFSNKKENDMPGLSDLTLLPQDMEYLREKLLIVQDACASFDISASQNALNDLAQKKWPRQVADRLDTIAVHLLHSAFAEAAEAAKRVIPGH